MLLEVIATYALIARRSDGEAEVETDAEGIDPGVDG
jgi:hypothetical protein